MPAPLTTRLLFCLELWLRARLLPWQVPRGSLDQVLKLATFSGAPSYPGLPLSYVVRKVAHAVRHPWLMRDRRCLREGLLGYRFLRKAGYEPKLCFGVDPASVSADRLAAHCWVEVDGKTVLGASATPMLPILIHPEKDAPCR